MQFEISETQNSYAIKLYEIKLELTANTRSRLTTVKSVIVGVDVESKKLATLTNLGDGVVGSNYTVNFPRPNGISSFCSYRPTASSSWRNGTCTLRVANNISSCICSELGEVTLFYIYNDPNESSYVYIPTVGKL